MTEQSRANNYIEVFEGFKLGSLGAGRKITDRKADSVDKRRIEKIRIIYELTKEKENRKDLRNVKWEDFDGFMYKLSLKSPNAFRGVDDWSVELLQAWPDSPGADRGNIIWRIQTNPPDTAKASRRLYERLLPIVKSKGIDGLMDLNKLTDFDIVPAYKSKFKTWFMNKESSRR